MVFVVWSMMDFGLFKLQYFYLKYIEAYIGSIGVGVPLADCGVRYTLYHYFDIDLATMSLRLGDLPFFGIIFTGNTAPEHVLLGFVGFRQ